MDKRKVGLLDLNDVAPQLPDELDEQGGCIPDVIEHLPKCL